MEDKIVLIAGAQSILGEELTTELTYQGIKYVCLDKYYGTHIDEGLEKYLNNACGQISHVVYITQVHERLGEPIDFVRNNIEVFINVCNACNKHKVKLVYTSSPMACKGNDTNIYGIGKRFMEEYARIYCPTATGLRLYNLYTFDFEVAEDFCLETPKETIVNSEDDVHLRYFTYAPDAAKAVFFAMSSEALLYNVVGGESMSLKTFMSFVTKHKPKNFRLDFEIPSMFNEREYIDEDVPSLPRVWFTSVEEAFMKFYVVTKNNLI